MRHTAHFRIRYATEQGQQMVRTPEPDPWQQSWRTTTGAAIISSSTMIDLLLQEEVHSVSLPALHLHPRALNSKANPPHDGCELSIVHINSCVGEGEGGAPAVKKFGHRFGSARRQQKYQSTLHMLVPAASSGGCLLLWRSPLPSSEQPVLSNPCRPYHDQRQRNCSGAAIGQGFTIPDTIEKPDILDDQYGSNAQPSWTEEHCTTHLHVFTCFAT